jgi:hypothetical protein
MCPGHFISVEEKKKVLNYGAQKEKVFNLVSFVSNEKHLDM